LPTAADVAERRREMMRQQIEQVLTDEDGRAPYMDVIEPLTEEHDALEIAAAILKLYAEETGRSATPEQKEDDVAMYAAAMASAGRGESGMTRLFINIGRNQGVRPQDFVGAIANEAGIPGRSIGAIDLFDTYSFVDVPADAAQLVIQALGATRIKGRAVSAEIAQPGGAPRRDERPAGRGFGGRDDRPPFRGGGRDDRFSGPPRRDDRPPAGRGFGERDGGFRRDDRPFGGRDDRPPFRGGGRDDHFSGPPRRNDRGFGPGPAGPDRGYGDREAGPPRFDRDARPPARFDRDRPPFRDDRAGPSRHGGRDEGPGGRPFRDRDDERGFGGRPPRRDFRERD
jgi:hypothetical protein